MRYLFIIIFVMSWTCIIAQSTPYTIDQKQVGNKIQFYGKNNSTKTIEVTLSLKDYTKENLKGYNEPVTKVFRPKQKLLFFSIELIGPTSYTYETQWIEKGKAATQRQVVSSKPGEPRKRPTTKSEAITKAAIDAKIAELGDQGIVLFDKAGCSRCSRAASFLADNNIEYTRMDITDNGIESAVMWELIRASGFKKNNLQTPAIMVDGEISHSHKNLTKFLESLLD